MLVQQQLIARVREVCAADRRVDVALMYGSFAHGEGDSHSDIEFRLFFVPQRRAEVDPRAWCTQIAPLTHMVVNEYGTHVAFFPNLVRGEFHFVTSDDIASVRSWPARGAPVDRMIVADRSGTLRAALELVPEQPAIMATGAEIEALCGRFANWLVLAHHVNERGEVLRAVDALAHVQRHLLWMARLIEGQTRHWLTPSRRAETDLPPATVAAVTRTVACAVTPGEVRRCIQAAWRCGRDYWQQLAARSGTPAPETLFDELNRATNSP